MDSFFCYHLMYIHKITSKIIINKISKMKDIGIMNKDESEQSTSAKTDKSLNLSGKQPQQLLSILQKQTRTHTIIGLKLSYCSMFVKQMKMLSQINLHKVKQLELDYNYFSNPGMQVLTKIPLENLQNIRLKNCRIGDQGIKYLEKAYWPKIQKLLLNNNNIGYEGYISMYKLFAKKLKTLSLFTDLQAIIGVMGQVCNQSDRILINYTINNMDLSFDIGDVLFSRSGFF